MKVITISVATAAIAFLPIAQARHAVEMMKWEAIFGSTFCLFSGGGVPTMPQHPDHNAMSGCHGVLARRLRIHHADGTSETLG